MLPNSLLGEGNACEIARHRLTETVAWARLVTVAMRSHLIKDII